ncbi:MAG: ParB family protein [Geminicoccales bacterium]
MLTCLSNTGDVASDIECRHQGFESVGRSADLSFDRVSATPHLNETRFLGSRFQRLDVDRVVPFDNGPRLLRNPKWQSIKAAIKASGGLTDTLPVTTRPGETHFICHQGGNTRLLVLQELFDETADPRFGQVQVEIVPFTSDFDLTVLHDRENTCRGDLTYIEEAWSKYRLYEMYCAKADGKKTARAFVDMMRRDHGLEITAAAFSRIKYTVEVLYQHIPTCLVQGGMSLRAVRRLIQLRHGLKKAWLDRSIGSGPHFEETFYGLLARQDQDLALSFVRQDSPADQFPDQRIVIDWNEFQQDFQHELSVYADVSYQKSIAWTSFVFSNDDDTNNVPITPKTSSATADSLPSICVSPPIEQIRAKAYEEARKIAAKGGLEHLVVPSEEGFGYSVDDEIPSSASRQSKASWWALVLATSPADVVARYANSAMGTPSFVGLSAETLMSLSQLFAQHARIVAKEFSDG